MKCFEMIATNAFDHKEWLRAQGFKWIQGAWRKETTDAGEPNSVQEFARGKFKFQCRPAGFSDHEWEVEVERRWQRERVKKAQSNTSKMIYTEEERAKFYAEGSGYLNAPRSGARYAKAPFAGHSPSGPRSLFSDVPGDEK